MATSTYRIRAAILLPVILLFSTVAFAQEIRKLPVDDFYGDIKNALSSHYTGKIVKTKMPIPATKRGIEITDGTLQSVANPTETPPPAAALAGDELIIKSFKVTDADIELILAKTEPPPKKRSSNPFATTKPPRISLRFTRELTTKDLTIENINRMLAAAIDVTSLAPPVVEKSAGTPQVSVSAPQPETAAKSDEQVNAQGLPAANVIGEVPSLSPGVGELTIECPSKPARVYIDGAYSGLAPRTVRLRSGVHTILVVSDEHTSWEQKLFIPGGKASVVRVELQRAMK